MVCHHTHLILSFFLLPLKKKLLPHRLSVLRQLKPNDLFCKTSSVVTTSKFYFGFWYGPYVLKFICHFKSRVNNHSVISILITLLKHKLFPTFRCQQTQFQIANVLADMAEMKLQEKEQQEAFRASPLPKGLQFFMRGLAKKTP